MNTDTHPETDTLQAYLRDIDAAEHAELRMHLANCTSCRNEVNLLSALGTHHAMLDDTAEGRGVLDEKLHQQIMEYVEGSLPIADRSEIESLVNNNPYAMKAALHYASHRSDSQQATGTNNRSERHEATSFNLGEWLASCFTWRAPLWAAVPATALTIAVVIFTLQSWQPGLSPSNDRLVVASYQDNPVIQFRNQDALPGIGFFSKAGRTTTAYNQIDVEVVRRDEDSSDLLRLRWPRVEHAAQYNMRLQVFDKGEKRALGEMNTVTNTASFEIDSIQNNRRYEWILSGATEDNKTFYSTGGFIISGTR